MYKQYPRPVGLLLSREERSLHRNSKDSDDQEHYIDDRVHI